jgi:hypothetical protein
MERPMNLPGTKSICPENGFGKQTHPRWFVIAILFSYVLIVGGGRYICPCSFE